MGGGAFFVHDVPCDLPLPLWQGKKPPPTPLTSPPPHRVAEGREQTTLSSPSHANYNTVEPYTCHNYIQKHTHILSLTQTHTIHCDIPEQAYFSVPGPDLIQSCKWLAKDCTKHTVLHHIHGLSNVCDDLT